MPVTVAAMLVGQVVEGHARVEQAVFPATPREDAHAASRASGLTRGLLRAMASAGHPIPGAPDAQRCGAGRSHGLCRR